MNTRTALAATGLAASALLIAGCAAGPAVTPSSTPEPPAADERELHAAWLDEGRLFAVVTYGSSTCVPVVDTVTAEGQSVTVTFAEEEPRACTMDYMPRASLAGLPEGVDPTQDVTITVIDPAVADETPRTELDGQDALAGHGGEPTDYAPSAGWFSDQELVLLTWGSSSCPPVVESITEAQDAATVTFVTDDRACTMDLAPRLTVLGFAQEHDDDVFVLTLDGDGFDSVTVQPIEN